MLVEGPVYLQHYGLCWVCGQNCILWKTISLLMTQVTFFVGKAISLVFNCPC